MTMIVGGALLRINHKPIKIHNVPCIITELIRNVNHFTGKFLLPSNSQLSIS